VNGYHDNSVGNVHGGEGTVYYSNPAGASSAGYGLYVESDSRANEVALTNTVGGDPIAYLYGVDGLTVEGLVLDSDVSSSNLGKVVVLASTDVTVRGNIVSGQHASGGTSSYSNLAGGTGQRAVGIRIEDCEMCGVIENDVSSVVGGVGGASGNGSGGRGGDSVGILVISSPGTYLEDNFIHLIGGAQGGSGSSATGNGGDGFGVLCLSTSEVILAGNQVSDVRGGDGGTECDESTTTTSGGSGGRGVAFGFREASVDNEGSANAAQDIAGGTGFHCGHPTAPAGNDQMGYGFYFDQDSLANSIALSNTHEAEPVVFIHGVDGEHIFDLVLDGGHNPTNLGKVVLHQSANVTIERCVVAGSAGENGVTGTSSMAAPIGQLGVGVRVAECANCTIRNTQIGTVVGGGGGVGARFGHGGVGGDATAILVEGSSGFVLTNLLLSAGQPGTGGLGGSLSPGKADDGVGSCVRVDSDSAGSLHLATCDGPGAQDGEVRHGVVLDDQPTPIQLVDSIITGVSGYCLYNDDANAPALLSATYSNLFECGQGQAYNAMVSGTCISEDPLFADAESGDFHLQPESPCIDTGKPVSEYENEPAPNGCRVNMGAYGNMDEATSKVGAEHCE
jgi:hypothetical protein